MARIRNDSWKNDLQLKDALQHHIKNGLNRSEILDFMQRDFSQYAWSSRTLDRRLQHFEIRCTNREISVDQVRDVVRKELQGPGRLLGYRAMHQKIRQFQTGVMATMHAYLRQQHGDMDASETVLFGPSTSNQVECICQ